MRVLVIGSGAREHVLVWKLAQSRRVEKIFAAPGNPGMAALAEGIPLAVDRIVELADFAVSARVDLTVVGPEVPLVSGIVDYFKSRGLKIFGPTKAAARLEGSKVFAKSFMERRRIPTAPFQIVEDLNEALACVRKADFPFVLKADGLAAGKGVVVPRSMEEAAHALNSILGNKIFGEAGNRVVIEERLRGEEVSVLAVVDGTDLILLEPSQDHKRAFDGDEGPNTGGMGAYCPVPMLDAPFMDRIRREIFEPAVSGMAEEGTPFSGILYAGLMLTETGPKVLEFNVRFGDPEAQAILPRLKTDLMEIVCAAEEGDVNRVRLDWDSQSSACVVLASAGYPGRYDVGRPISGLKEAADIPNVLLFHAGTRQQGSEWVTWGGRILSIVGLGETLGAALDRCYQTVDRIHFEGKQFRTDIGARALRYKAARGVG